MTRPNTGTITAALWFIAGALAWIAVIIRYTRGAELSWTWAAAGLICIVLGISALKRSRGTGGRDGPY